MVIALRRSLGRHQCNPDPTALRHERSHIEQTFARGKRLGAFSGQRPLLSYTRDDCSLDEHRVLISLTH